MRDVFMTPLGALLSSIYRVFLRVLPRAGYSRFGLYGVHPRRRLGGAGGPAAPFRGDRGDTPPVFVNSRLYDFYGGFPLPVGEGFGVGPHKSLLDLLVRTDTKGVSWVGKGSPYVPVVCDVCGAPVRRCLCRPGRDY